MSASRFNGKKDLVRAKSKSLLSAAKAERFVNNHSALNLSI